MSTPELKPCPFCGGGATIRRVSHGYSPGGGFNAKYEIGCNECDIKFTRESKFILIYGKPKIEKDGYQECIDDWNRRVSDKNA